MWGLNISTYFKRQYTWNFTRGMIIFYSSSQIYLYHLQRYRLVSEELWIRFVLNYRHLNVAAPYYKWRLPGMHGTRWHLLLNMYGHMTCFWDSIILIYILLERKRHILWQQLNLVQRKHNIHIIKNDFFSMDRKYNTTVHFDSTQNESGYTFNVHRNKQYPTYQQPYMFTSSPYRGIKHTLSL